MKDLDDGGPSSITIRIEYLNAYSFFNSDIVSFVYETDRGRQSIIFLIFVFWGCILHILCIT